MSYTYTVYVGFSDIPESPRPKSKGRAIEEAQRLALKHGMASAYRHRWVGDGTSRNKCIMLCYADNGKLDCRQYR